jgi:hypothetical protein
MNFVTVPFHRIKRDQLGMLREVFLCWISATLLSVGMVLYLIDPEGLAAQGVFNWLVLSNLFSIAVVYLQVSQNILRSWFFSYISTGIAVF